MVIALFALWLLLSGIFEPFLLSLGVVSCVLVAWIAHRMDVVDHEGFPIHMGPKAITYWPWLIWEIIKANIDVALIIIKPEVKNRSICPSSKHLGRLSLFYKGGSGSPRVDVKPLVADGSSGVSGLSVS